MSENAERLADLLSRNLEILRGHLGQLGPATGSRLGMAIDVTLQPVVDQLSIADDPLEVNLLAQMYIRHARACLEDMGPSKTRENMVSEISELEELVSVITQLAPHDQQDGQQQDEALAQLAFIGVIAERLGALGE